MGALDGAACGVVGWVLLLLLLLLLEVLELGLLLLLLKLTLSLHLKLLLLLMQPLLNQLLLLRNLHKRIDE